jgi:hypothetical protein
MSRYTFYSSLLILCFTYGMAAQKYQLFPAPLIHSLVVNAKLAVNELRGDTKSWYYIEAKNRPQVAHYKADEVQPGLTLITGLGLDRSLVIKAVDFAGQVVHQWNIDWHKIWPDATHIDPEFVPRGQPGTHIHGSRLMDNGDIVFNFENLGLVRLDACGNTVFKAPNFTHHSIDIDQQGNFWVPGQVNHKKKWPQFPNYVPPFKDDLLVKLSDKGQVLQEISMMSVLNDNGYQGLMYLSTIKSRKIQVSGDVYHLNDIEVFPTTLAEGIFKHGDLLVSLRNINTVLVLDPVSLTIRYLTTGKFVRQHDADFIDGNTFSVYDNNNIAAPGHNNSSKIVMISALDNSLTEYISGTEALPFYSMIMGKHQWLRNGNLLIAESMNGRAFEINSQKQLVWEYNNLIAQTDVVGIMEGATRLAPKFNAEFFSKRLAACQN